MQWVYELEHESLGIPKPDVVIALDVPAAVRMSLIQKRSLETGKPIDTTDAQLEHQIQADIALHELPNYYPQTRVVQGMSSDILRSPDEIHEEVYDKIRDIL